MNYKNHKTIHYTHATDYPEIINSELYKNLQYDSLDNVFFTVFYGDKTHLIFFIVENDKIISFFGK